MYIPYPYPPREKGENSSLVMIKRIAKQINRRLWKAATNWWEGVNTGVRLGGSTFCT